MVTTLVAKPAHSFFTNGLKHANLEVLQINNICALQKDNIFPEIRLECPKLTTLLLKRLVVRHITSAKLAHATIELAPNFDPDPYLQLSELNTPKQEPVFQELSILENDWSNSSQFNNTPSWIQALQAKNVRCYRAKDNVSNLWL